GGGGEMGGMRDRGGSLVGRVKGSVGTTEENGPTFRADDPRDGDARALVGQVEFVDRRARAGLTHIDRLHTLALAVDQGKRTAAAVELLAALTQTEDRAAPCGKADDSLPVDVQALAWMAGTVRERDCEGSRRSANAATVPIDNLGCGQRANVCQR